MYFFETTYLILVTLQAVAVSKKFLLHALNFTSYCLIRRTLISKMHDLVPSFLLTLLVLLIFKFYFSKEKTSAY